MAKSDDQDLKTNVRTPVGDERKTGSAPDLNNNSATADQTRVPGNTRIPDKTRIQDKTKVPNNSQPPEKTRVPKAARTPDKTRIKTSPAAAANQRNNIKQAPKKNTNLSQSDVTRYNPSARRNAQQNSNAPSGSHKTRIRGKQGDTTPSVDSPVGAQTQVLKDRFLLEKVLGVGGMGVVYKAKDRLKVEAKDRDPYVAIKVLSEEFKTHPEAFIALQRESRKAQRIAHPNTVKVYDFDRDGDVVFMTMEYMVGKPLDQMIKQYHATGLPRDDAWNILSGMCSALIHAHNENIVHSDFKPGNVFVTDSGMAKIFDFGIARAVANIDRQTGKALDRTVFDAGSLGALTPAYASMEMLLGKTPDIRDDIYALGCIAYEIFTGEHPFNRLPADEAYNKNLRPKRITDISKRQWKAVESALAFKRENRIESVEEFYRQLTSKRKPKYLLVASVLLVATVSFIVYSQFFDRKNIDVSQTDMRSELEFEIRYKLYKEKIEQLLAEPIFSNDWETTLWNEVKAVSDVFPGEPNEWYFSTREKIYRLYVDKIREVMNKSDFVLAKTLIANAYRYTDDPKLLDNEQRKLTVALRIQSEKDKRLAVDRRKTGTTRITREEQNKKSSNLFNVALNNVNKQLECSSRLNMRDFKIAITKLRSLDSKRYNTLENSLTKRLAGCITAIGKRYPEHALDSKRYALRIFKNNPAILAIAVKERDACDVSIAGLGARGDRAVCRDKLQGGGSGPALVVIPGNGRIKPFAIGKYEVSSTEVALFCKQSKKCNIKLNGRQNLPATNIDVTVASAYLKWLSKKTRKKYRLPTKREWVYAAKSKSYTLDPNRNCQLNTRGIEKGGKLVRTNTGKQNGWGLVNYAGNVQEWVYDTGRKLVAIGGSYESLMDVCTPETVISHSGKPDTYTGFRVVRDLEI